jgi:hypothetical protein
VLTLLPFTAPFATCDAGTLFGQDPLASQIVWPGHADITPTRMPVNSDATSVSPFRLQAATSRARAFAHLSPVSRVATGRDVSAGGSRDALRTPQQSLGRTTVLRI